MHKKKLYALVNNCNKLFLWTLLILITLIPTNILGQSTLSFTPEIVTENVGSSFSVDVVIDPKGESMLAAAIYFTFDPTYLEILDVTPYFPLPVIGPDFDNKTGTFGYEGGSATAINSSFTALTITFGTKAVTEGSILAFDPDLSNIVNTSIQSVLSNEDIHNATIHINCSTTQSDAGTDQEICNTTTTLSANTPSTGETGSWSVISGAGGTFVNPSNPNTTFSGVRGTAYVLEWEIDDGECVTKDSVEIFLQLGVTEASAGSDQDICGNTTTLLGNSPGIGELGTWAIASGDGNGLISKLNSNLSSFSGTEGASYTLTWSISNGSICPATIDSVTISLKNAPKSNAGEDQEICEASTTLEAVLSTGTGGSWSIISGIGGSLLDQSDPRTTFSGNPGTVYTLVWEEVNINCTGNTDTVNITLYDDPTTANAGNDQIVCGNSTTLAANAANGFQETGTWTIVSGDGNGYFGNVPGTTSTNNPTDIFTGTQGASYTLRYTISNGVCSPSSDDILIQFNQAPTAQAGEDQEICEASTTLEAVLSTGTGGSWSIISGIGGSLLDQSDPRTTFSGNPGTVYTLVWEEVNINCTGNTDTVNITLYDDPTTANAGNDQIVCGNSTTLAANAANGFQETGTWTIVSGDGNGYFGNVPGTTSTDNPTDIFTGTQGESYTLRYTISNGVCSPTSDDVIIQFNQAPTAQAGDDQEICGTSTTLEAVLSTGIGGSWSIISGSGGSLLDKSDPTTTFSGNPGTLYTLVWEELNSGCSNSTDTVSITFYSNVTTPEAGTDQTVCNYFVNLSANIPLNDETGIWSIVSGEDGSFVIDNGTDSIANDPATTFQGVPGSTYTLRWTISNGKCQNNFDEVNISFLEPPTAFAGEDQILCDTIATLSAEYSTGTSGIWNIIQGAGGALDDLTNPTTTFSGKAGTTYVLTWEEQIDNCSSDIDTVSISLSQVLTMADAGPDQTTCGDTVSLRANEPDTSEIGTWSIIEGDGNGYFGPTQDNVTSNFSNIRFTGTPGETYTLRWTISRPNCPGTSDDITIQLGEPFSTFAGPDQNICDTTTTLQAILGTDGTGIWTILTGTGGVLEDSSSAVSQFSGTVNQTYTLIWREENFTCFDEDTVEIRFHNILTQSYAGIDQQTCTDSVNLKANTPKLGETGTWSIITGVGGILSDLNDPLTTFWGKAGETYELEWKISDSLCTPTLDTLRITFLSSPLAVAGSDLEICGSSTFLNAVLSNTSHTGFWSLLTDDGNGMILNPSNPISGFSGSNGFTYSLVWTETNGVCIDTDTVLIHFLHNTLADAGTLVPIPITCYNELGPVTLIALEDVIPLLPSGYTQNFILTTGEELTILEISDQPSFSLADTGTYRIHSLVYDPMSLDTSIVQPGTTTASDLLNIIALNNECADIDLQGALFQILYCNFISDCTLDKVVTYELDNWMDSSSYWINHAIYLFDSALDPLRQYGNDNEFQRFRWKKNGTLKIINDTLAVVEGIVISVVDTAAKMDVLLELKRPRNWSEWHAMGGTFHLPPDTTIHPSIYENHKFWKYWEIGENSRLEGIGALSGTLELIQAPTLETTPMGEKKGIQMGMGANDKDTDWGISGWFYANGTMSYNGEPVDIFTQGDINADIIRTDTTCGSTNISPYITNFSAQSTGNGVTLAWGAITEGDAGYIVVERSIDGQTYEALDVINGTNGLLNPRVHTFTDAHAEKTNIYFYRLKVVKANGTYYYSSVQSVNLPGVTGEILRIYPNPVTHNELNIVSISPSVIPFEYQIVDLSGRILIKGEIAPTGRKILDMSRLSTGMYILHITQENGESVVKRITKK